MRCELVHNLIPVLFADATIVAETLWPADSDTKQATFYEFKMLLNHFSMPKEYSD